MVISQERSKRKPTGGSYHAYRKKRTTSIGRVAAMTGIGEKRVRVVRTRGGNTKIKLLSTKEVNLLDKKTGKYIKASIRGVVDNPANRHFIRRNIITKGAVIETDKGKAKVTNRPGQDGFINAVLV